MSYAPQRSMNGSLKNGMTDGTYRKKNANRGGFVELTTEETRDDLYPLNFNQAESSYKTQPDGTQRTESGNVYYHTPMRHQG